MKTSVSCFTGATSTSDGTSGYVPAPSAGMQDDYYLCGNGEWVEYLSNIDWVNLYLLSSSITIMSIRVSSTISTVTENDFGTYTYTVSDWEFVSMVIGETKEEDGTRYFRAGTDGVVTGTITVPNNTTNNVPYIGHKYRVIFDPSYSASMADYTLTGDALTGTIDELPMTISIAITDCPWRESTISSFTKSFNSSTSYSVGDTYTMTADTNAYFKVQSYT